jgi:3-phosphoshikimate 1-carboxyvinyltransferase
VYLSVKPSHLRGTIRIPASKSHTIRGVLVGFLAEGTSRLFHPLEAADTLSAIRCAAALGADVERQPDCWIVRGTGGRLPSTSVRLDVGNSGTTLGNLIAVCAIGSAPITLDGDASIRTRPYEPLLSSLKELGATVESAGPRGTAPITIHGPLRGGSAHVNGTTSIYLTPLLVASPLLADDTQLTVAGTMNEKGYVRMTLDWLQAAGVAATANGDLTRLAVRGRQHYAPVERSIAADFSSAAFPACAAVLAADPDVSVLGLDFDDPQGDKQVFDHLEKMGASFEIDGDRLRIRRAAALHGIRMDLSDTPDALPMLAVVGCFAEGETVLHNVAMARIKETDRIAVMCTELRKMGADIEERPDGLVIRKSRLHGAHVHGHDDHRVVMALAVAGLLAEGETRVDGAESVKITYPTFIESMRALGADMRGHEG